MKFINIKCITSRPLKPSIKLAPLITNKKHNKINIISKNLFVIHDFTKLISILSMLMERKIILKDKAMIIKINLIFGLVFSFISSKKPIEKKIIDKNK